MTLPPLILVIPVLLTVTLVNGVVPPTAPLKVTLPAPVLKARDCAPLIVLPNVIVLSVVLNVVLVSRDIALL